MPMPAEAIVSLIQAALPDSTVVLQDLAGDNDHWSVVVTSTAFIGKTRIQQHQLIYAALGGRVGQELHALSIQTLSPSS